jgi:hypothetical protein
VIGITFWSFLGFGCAERVRVSGATRAWRQTLAMVPVDDAGRNPHRPQKSIELEAYRC